MNIGQRVKYKQDPNSNRKNSEKFPKGFWIGTVLNSDSEHAKVEWDETIEGEPKIDTYPLHCLEPMIMEKRKFSSAAPLEKNQARNLHLHHGHCEFEKLGLELIGCVGVINCDTDPVCVIITEIISDKEFRCLIEKYDEDSEQDTWNKSLEIFHIDENKFRSIALIEFEH